jgi:hypothetical protein
MKRRHAFVLLAMLLVAGLLLPFRALFAEYATCHVAERRYRFSPLTRRLSRR